VGGTNNEDGNGIALDKAGNLYTTGYSKGTWGTPVWPFIDSSDAYVAKIAQPPLDQADNVTVTPLMTDADITWHRGSGENCAVFMKQGDNGTASPVNGTSPTANTVFGGGSEIPSTGWFCVYNGTDDNVTVTGLAPETAYRVMVCEYNGSVGTEQYNTSTATGNPASFTTYCELAVFPRRIHRLLSFIMPLKVFVMFGSEDTAFEREDNPEWDSEAIRPLFKLRLGRRLVLAFTFVNPLALTAPGTAQVTIGDCMAQLEVVPF
jgi:hypothetical protein